MDRSNDDNDLEEYFTIPNGVKVIEVYASAYIIDGTDHIIRLSVYSDSSTWIYASDDGGIYHTVYVGVTPNKKYHVYAVTESRENEDCKIDRFYIKYSPEINNKTPTVTDY